MAWQELLGTALGGGAITGAISLVKQVLDKSDLKKKLEEFEAFKPKLEELQKQVADGIARLVLVETQAKQALADLQAASRLANRQARQSTGDASAAAAAMRELEAQRKLIEALRADIDALKQQGPASLQRLSTLEERLSSHEEHYRDDYATLLEKVAGVTGEFKQAMRSKYGARNSDG